MPGGSFPPSIATSPPVGGAAPFPKGRPVETSALDELRALFKGRQLRPDLLIECLHAVQDRFGALSTAHLNALAELLNLAPAAVWEVASFYAHFDLLREGETPAPLTVRVCESLVCAISGGRKLAASLATKLGAEVRVLSAPCMGACDRAPVAAVGHRQFFSADAEAMARLIAQDAHLAPTPMPTFRSLDAYLASGGYRYLREGLRGARKPEDLLNEIDTAGLRGMGGAGFPAARKWRAVAQNPKPRYVVVNADEGEPGTFKDRYCLERDPHRVIDGALLAAWAVGAGEVYLYLRDEYAHLYDRLAQEIAEVELAGLGGEVAIRLRRGAGSYVCGEETALLESLEGKRGLPRQKPPLPVEAGLFGRPTLVTNVETLYWASAIAQSGGAWFRGLGKQDRAGLRLYSVSGRVRRPGVKEAPAGVTLAELIENYCGGMAEGHELKAFLPGGASGGIMPASLADLPLDFGSFEPHGGFIGSAAVIVLSEADDLRAAANNLMRFFASESCGQCTPCRIGTEKLAQMMEGETWDESLMREVGQAMRDASICGLGQAAPNALLSLFSHFPELAR